MKSGGGQANAKNRADGFRGCCRAAAFLVRAHLFAKKS